MAQNSADNSTIVLNRGDSSVTVNLFGATLVSWKVDGEEVLFVSKDAVFDNKKAIRGGIPFVFPNFGPWALGPQHGFARTSMWSVAKEPEKLENGDVETVLTLADSDGSKAIWDYEFRILYTITLKENELGMDVKVKNEGDESFPFTILLHTYLNVPDVTKCLITGLSGCIYQDKVKDGESFTESRFDVCVSEFTDRVYQNTSREHLVTNCSGGRNIKILKENFPDTVIWNPWKENAIKMGDFGNDEYLKMICVEAGSVSERVTLMSGEIYHATQALKIVDGL